MVKVTKTPKTPKNTKRKEPNANEEAKENEAKRPRQAGIMNFFPRVDKPPPPPTVPNTMSNSRFKPFQIKEGMTLAPILFRAPLSTEEHDNLLNAINVELSDHLVRWRSYQEKRPASNTSELKAKYFHFHDNHRPPYYGTWRQHSKVITGRRPLGKEERLLNYEYDSDEDWEDEPADADECKSDEEELEKDNPEEEGEENDGFFVEHGYLSADEGSEGYEEEEFATGKKTKSNRKKSIDEEEKQNSSGTVETEEQRRIRLEKRAAEWREMQRQKERRFRKRNLQPLLYIPEKEPVMVPVYHRFILPGVQFDYRNMDERKREQMINSSSLIVKENKKKQPVEISSSKN